MEQGSPAETRRSLVRLGAALVALALGAAGCGLPDPGYLNPPTVTYSGDPTVGTFSIQHTVLGGDSDIFGYELYYKLYADVNSIGTDANLGGTTGTTDGLAAKGFLPLCRGPAMTAPAGAVPQGIAPDVSSGNRAVPLVLVKPSDRTSSFAITVFVNPTVDTGTYFTYSAPSGTYSQQIDRHADITIGGVVQCKPFTYGQGYYLNADPDAGFLGSNPSPPVVYIAVYVASYGLLDLSTAIYSYPVYMGYLQVSGNFSR
jgi:hypothetical protein